MASLVAEVTNRDAGVSQTSRANPTAYNDEVNSSVANLVTGTGKLLSDGAAYISGMVSDEVTKNVSATFLEAKEQAVLNKGGVTEEVKAFLIKKHGHSFKNLPNASFQRLHLMQLEKDAMKEYPNQATAVRQAMLDVTGHTSQAIPVERELAERESIAAKAAVATINDMATQMRTKGYPVPRLPDGSIDARRLTEITMAVHNLGYTMGTIGDSFKESGGPHGGQSAGGRIDLRNLGKLEEFQKAIFPLAVERFQGTFKAILEAQNPEERLGASKALWVGLNTFKQSAFAGNFLGIPGAGPIFAQFNEAEKAFVFREMDAWVASTMKSLGMDPKAEPASLDAAYLAEVKVQADTINALMIRGLLTNENMRLFSAFTKMGQPEEAAKLLMKALTDSRKVVADAQGSYEKAKALVQESFDKIINAQPGIPDIATALSATKVVQAGDPDNPATQAANVKISEAVVEGKEEINTPANRKTAAKLLVTPQGVTHYEALKKNNPAMANAVYDAYSETTRGTISDQLEEIYIILPLEDRDKFSISAEGTIRYTGESGGIRRRVEETNQIINHAELYRGLVKDSRLLNPVVTQRTLETLQSQEYASTNPRGFADPHPFGAKHTVGSGEGPPISLTEPLNVGPVSKSVTAPRGLPNSFDPSLSEARGIRNNNPGNIKKGSDEWEGAVKGGDESFETFDSPESGIRAMAKTLVTYKEKHKINTLEDVINRWAPPEENDTASYIQFMEDYTGYSRKDKIDLKSPPVLIALAKGIILFENGSDPYGQEVPRGVQLALGKKIDEEGFLSKVASALNPISSAQAAAPTAEDFASLEAAKGEAGTAEDVVASGGLVQRGDKGGEVQQIQEALGVDTSDGGVGIFGPRTEKAVMEFQKANDDADGNALVVDGKVGPKTFAAILKKGGQQQSPMALNTEKVGDPTDLTTPLNKPQVVSAEEILAAEGKVAPKELTSSTIPEPVKLVMLAALPFAESFTFRTENYGEDTLHVLRTAQRTAQGKNKTRVDYIDYPDTARGLPAGFLVGVGMSKEASKRRKAVYPMNHVGAARFVHDIMTDPVLKAALTVGGWSIQEGGVRERFNFNNANQSDGDWYVWMRKTLSNSSVMPMTEDEGPKVIIDLEDRDDFKARGDYV